mgnify:CR=1 FL=1
MHETALDLGFAVKARDQFLIARQFAVQDFHGHIAIDPALKSLVHTAHRADAD